MDEHCTIRGGLQRDKMGGSDFDNPQLEDMQNNLWSLNKRIGLGYS